MSSKEITPITSTSPGAESGWYTRATELLTGTLIWVTYGPHRQTIGIEDIYGIKDGVLSEDTYGDEDGVYIRGTRFEGNPYTTSGTSTEFTIEGNPLVLEVFFRAD